MTFKQLLIVVVIGFGTAVFSCLVYEARCQCAVDAGNDRQDVHSCERNKRTKNGGHLLYCTDYEGYLRAVTIPKNVCTLKRIIAKCWSGSDASEPR